MRWKICIFFVFLAAALGLPHGSPTKADPVFHDNYLQSNYLGLEDHSLYPAQRLRHPVPIQKELTMKKFVDAVWKQKITTVEGAIKLLPQYMLDDNYVVLYRSRSIQGASPEEPRILVYTPTARFIVAFNGGKKKGGNTLEMMQFHDMLPHPKSLERRWELREFVFNPGKKPRLSQINPPKCLTCHQSKTRVVADPRPNWEPYNIWPGAIGSNSGSLSALLKNDAFMQTRAKPQDRSFLEEQSQEKEILDKFLAKAGSHPRYKLLEGLNIHAPTDLTDILGVLNFERMLRLMEAEKDVYEAHKELVSLLSKSDATEALESLLSPYQERAGFKGDYRLVSDRILTLFNGIGLDTSDWGMDFGTNGRFAAFEKFGQPSNALSTFDWVWKHYSRDRNSFQSHGPQDLAALIGEKSAAYWRSDAAKVRSAAQKNLPRPSAQTVLHRCARCHMDNADSELAPRIPFLDKDRFQEALQKKVTLSDETLFEAILRRTGEMASNLEQMPPSETLTKEEREALYDYLQSLMKK